MIHIAWNKLLLGFVCLTFFLMVACNPPIIHSHKQNPQATKILFSPNDLASAPLKRFKGNSFLKGKKGKAISNGEIVRVYADDTVGEVIKETTDLTGVICYIQHNPNSKLGVWRLWLHNLVEGTKTLVYADVKEIQAVSCSANGQTIAMSMRPTSNLVDDFEIYKLDLANKLVERLTYNNANDINAAINADGTRVVWEKKRNRKSTIFYRLYDLEGYTQSILINPQSQVQPKISSDGKNIAFVRQLANGYSKVMLYDISQNSYIEAFQSSLEQANPSLSDDGKVITWVEHGKFKEILKIKHLVTGTISNLAVSSTITHPQITSEGKWLSYQLNQDKHQGIYIQNVNTLSKSRQVFSMELVNAYSVHWAQPLKAISVATNERISLPLPEFNLEDLKLSLSEGYTAEIIETTPQEVIFDLRPDPSLPAETLINEKLKVIAETDSGDILAEQFYDVNTGFASTEIIVQGYPKKALKRKLKETPFAVKDYIVTPSVNFAVLDVGSQTTSEALGNLNDIILDVKENSTKNQQGLLAGFNYIYTPNGSTQHNRYVRSLDPACETLSHLRNYANEENWQIVSSNSLSPLSLQKLTKTNLAHSQGWLGDGVIVAILDSGVDENDASDCYNTATKEQHGTNVRDIIHLLAPNAHWVSKRVFGKVGKNSNDDLITTLDLVVAITDIEREYLAKGQKVIFNMSFSGPAHTQYGPDVTLWGIFKRLEEIYGDHFLVVTSAGNHGLDPEQRREVYYPAGFSQTFYGTTMTLPSVANVISVGTAGIRNGQLQAARLNPEIEAIDVLGLGIKLCLDNQNNSECALDSARELNGTSYAVPMVSAVAAILWQQQPSIQASELKNLIQNTSLAIANSSVGLARVEFETNQNSSLFANLEVDQQTLYADANDFTESPLGESLEENSIFAFSDLISDPSTFLTPLMPSGSTTSP